MVSRCQVARFQRPPSSVGNRPKHDIYGVLWQYTALDRTHWMSNTDGKCTGMASSRIVLDLQDRSWTWHWLCHQGLCLSALILTLCVNMNSRFTYLFNYFLLVFDVLAFKWLVIYVFCAMSFCYFMIYPLCYVTVTDLEDWLKYLNLQF